MMSIANKSATFLAKVIALCLDDLRIDPGRLPERKPELETATSPATIGSFVLIHRFESMLWN
jgi:hypothetical protein